MRSMTNGEKIRNMSDEELAQFLCENCHSCRLCIALLYCYDGNSDGFINWLKYDSDKE